MNTNESTEKFSRLRSLTSRKESSLAKEATGILIPPTESTQTSSKELQSLEKHSPPATSLQEPVLKQSEPKQDELQDSIKKITNEEKLTVTGSKETESDESPDVSLLDVRKKIWTTLARLKKNEIDQKEAQHILKSCSMIMQTVKLEMEVMKELKV